MRPDPIIPPQEGPFDMARLVRETVHAGILAVADDKAEMKDRIMRARECGHLSDQETTDWIIRHGLVHA